MDGSFAPRNRGCNVGVRLDLSELTERLFTALGAKGRFVGPGPCELEWLSSTTTRENRFAIDYLATELFSKFDDGSPSTAKRERAVLRFMEGERLCSLTNCCFGPNSAGQPPEWLDPLSDKDEAGEFYFAVFSRARSVISRILGAWPGYEGVLQYADYGPGATTRLSRRHSDRANKWAGRPHVSPFSTSPLEVVFSTYPLLKQRLQEPGYEIVAGNKLDWVPKNYKVDRTIAIEPDWQMFLQKGIGGLIRRKLKRVKIDLDNQETNRFLAAIGSIDGSLATLDLSMASDTVSYRLVEFLLRPDWFEALEQCRSHIGFYHSHDGVENAVLYEKFSSMGNGYTFELESLIFYALGRAVSELTGETDHRLYVYGDDIICPSGMVPYLTPVLQRAGFVVNEEKSFSSGPFRESCGGHYFDGCDVTPFYIREPVDSLDRLFLLHNNLYRWFNRHEYVCDGDSVRQLLNWVRSHAPPKWRRPRLLSEDVGDGAFIGSFDEVLPRKCSYRGKRAGWEGWITNVLQYKKRTPRGGARMGEPASEFPCGSGPDLASLWSIEKARPPRLFSHNDWWLRMISSRDDIDGTLGVARTAPSSIPHSERTWFVGLQVLPWEIGSSWW